MLLLKWLKVIEWLKNFLANIPLGMKPTPSVSIHCDCQSTITITKNKTYNENNRHLQLRHNLVKQLLKKRTIFIDYVKSERDLADPLTKPLGRNMILETSRGMGLKPLANKQVMETQPLWLEIPWIRFIWVKTSHLLVLLAQNWLKSICLFLWYMKVLDIALLKR